MRMSNEQYATPDHPPQTLQPLSEEEQERIALNLIQYYTVFMGSNLPFGLLVRAWLHNAYCSQACLDRTVRGCDCSISLALDIRNPRMAALSDRRPRFFLPHFASDSRAFEFQVLLPILINLSFRTTRYE